MFIFTEDERAFLSRMRGITQDPQGRAVLVGLTFEETGFYITYRRKFLTPERDRDREHQSRYLELHRKHEIARLEIAAGEVNPRNQNPTRQYSEVHLDADPVIRNNGGSLDHEYPAQE